MTSALTALDFLTAESIELVIVGLENQAKYVGEAYRHFIPIEFW